MGGDGGVVATQKKFMRGYKDPNQEKELKNVKGHQRLRTHVCAQSSMPLREPTVACEMGNLYNKEEVLTALLDKKLNEAFSHIRGLKDLKTLIYCPNPAYEASNEAEGESPAKYICPVTRTEFSGSLPFVVIWASGTVMSEKALKEIGVEGLQAEYGPFSPLDIVKLVPLDEELDLQRERMIARRIAQKSLKKDHKRKRDVIIEGAECEIKDNSSTIELGKMPTKKDGHIQKTGSSELKSASSSRESKKLSQSSSLAEEAVKTVERQEGKSSVFKKLFHKGHEADKHDRDLFMSVAGLRYTLS